MLLWYQNDSDCFALKQTKESIYWSAPYIIVMSSSWGCSLLVLCWVLRGSLLMNMLFTCTTAVDIWQSPIAIHHYTQTSWQLVRDYGYQSWFSFSAFSKSFYCKTVEWKVFKRLSSCIRQTISLLSPFPTAGTVLSLPCSWHVHLAPSTGTSCNTEMQAGIRHN